jgi:sugar lactone lactonase YvrE
VVVHGRGLRVLASGDTLIADQDRSLVVAVDGAGAVRNVTTDVANPNGLLLGPDQTAYVSDFGITGKVFRLDLSSGKTRVVAAPGKGSNGLALSPDGHWLYIGDHDLGIIHRVSVHLDGTYGGPEQVARGLVRPDGLTVDRCGMLYAASWNGKLYTVSTNGKVEVAAAFAGPVSAVSFGSGAHGFAADKLYVTAISEGGVYELDVGRHAAPPP